MTFSTSIEKTRSFEDLLEDPMRCMLPRQLWRKKFRAVEVIDEASKALVPVAIYQFHYPEYPIPAWRTLRDAFKPTLVFPLRKIYNWRDWRTPLYIEDLCYPHDDMKQRQGEFNRFNKRFVPKNLLERVEECKVMAEKIVACRKDDAEWFEALKEAKDHLFLCHNVEYRLGRNLDNKALWKLYLGYLKECDHKLLLQTYSKYCRCPCFRDNEDMLREYEEIAKRLSMVPVAVPWRNPFAFERFDPAFFHVQWDGYAYQRNRYLTHYPAKFYANNAIIQNYSLPAPIVEYLGQNAPAELLQKLYKCCKKMYTRFPAALCHKVTVPEVDDFQGSKKCYMDQDSLTINPKFVAKLNLPKIYVGNDLSFEEPLKLHLFLPYVYRCTAEKVVIWRQTLKWCEIQKLLAHGRTKEFRASLSGDKDYVIEDVMQLMPNLEKTCVYNVQCTKETSAKLLDMKFNSKITFLELGGLKQSLIEPIDFAKFVIKSCSPDALVQLHFDGLDNEKYRQNFEKIVSEAVKIGWGSNTKFQFRTR